MVAEINAAASLDELEMPRAAVANGLTVDPHRRALEAAIDGRVTELIAAQKLGDEVRRSGAEGCEEL